VRPVRQAARVDSQQPVLPFPVIVHSVVPKCAITRRWIPSDRKCTQPGVSDGSSNELRIQKMAPCAAIAADGLTRAQNVEMVHHGGQSAASPSTPRANRKRQVRHVLALDTHCDASLLRGCRGFYQPCPAVKLSQQFTGYYAPMDASVAQTLLQSLPKARRDQLMRAAGGVGEWLQTLLLPQRTTQPASLPVQHPGHFYWSHPRQIGVVTPLSCCCFVQEPHQSLRQPASSTRRPSSSLHRSLRGCM
jgi:hypothetical protein